VKSKEKREEKREKREEKREKRKEKKEKTLILNKKQTTNCLHEPTCR